ncbi:hypothetical protein SAMN05421837_107614 [Amycolatopsis pretoriensis]|uniref:Uncharacterized protein n=1 Tax=Amycolatopsis pretoriensis TaxID=218821 RepID=A0A1H5R8X8_9PSEU|nr:hypothetical protein [Amycolatopsis pretoriensis]SEF34862.1 hypothetical protein SAMN05421837_107614 [Amycolatopsis pretoriensis]
MEGPATRLTIYIGEDDHWHHKPLVGASVLRGVEGYGAFLPQLDELIGEGLVTLDQVEVVRYVGRTE